MGQDNPYACKKCGKHKGGGMAVPREKLCSCEPCPGCAERDAKIAELEKRPTHESVLAWLETSADVEIGSAKAYRAEFMEPTDAD